MAGTACTQRHPDDIRRWQTMAATPVSSGARKAPNKPSGWPCEYREGVYSQGTVPAGPKHRVIGGCQSTEDRVSTVSNEPDKT